MSLASIGLSLGSLQLDLAIVNLNVDIEFVSKLFDIVATFANEVVGKLLWEIKCCGIPPLKLILLLLLNESEDFGMKVFYGVRRPADADIVARGSTSLRSITEKHLDGDLVAG